MFCLVACFETCAVACWIVWPVLVFCGVHFIQSVLFAFSVLEWGKYATQNRTGVIMVALYLRVLYV